MLMAMTFVYSSPLLKMCRPSWLLYESDIADSGSSTTASTPKVDSAARTRGQESSTGEPKALLALTACPDLDVLGLVVQHCDLFGDRVAQRRAKERLGACLWPHRLSARSFCSAHLITDHRAQSP